MHKRIELHDGVIRPQLVAELEASRPPAGRVSSYYLDLNPGQRDDHEVVRIIAHLLNEHRAKRPDTLPGERTPAPDDRSVARPHTQTSVHRHVARRYVEPGVQR